MVEKIFENKLILITLVASILPMVMSFLMVLAVVIAHSVNVRYERKQAERLKAKRVAMKRDRLRRERLRHLEDGGSSALDASMVADQNNDEQTEGEEGQVNPAIQSILSSVFADDDVEAQYDVLLEGREPVDIHQLQHLAEQIRSTLGEIAS